MVITVCCGNKTKPNKRTKTHHRHTHKGEKENPVQTLCLVRRYTREQHRSWTSQLPCTCEGQRKTMFAFVYLHHRARLCNSVYGSMWQRWRKALSAVMSSLLSTFCAQTNLREFSTKQITKPEKPESSQQLLYCHFNQSGTVFLT